VLIEPAAAADPCMACVTTGVTFNVAGGVVVVCDVARVMALMRVLIGAVAASKAFVIAFTSDFVGVDDPRNNLPTELAFEATGELVAGKTT
jgi:hypothetical protein